MLTEAADAGSVPEGVYLKVSACLKQAYEVKDEPPHLRDSINNMREVTQDRVRVYENEYGGGHERVWTSDMDEDYFEYMEYLANRVTSDSQSDRYRGSDHDSD